MSARHGVSGLNRFGAKLPPPRRRGGAVDAERRTSAPEPELLGQPLAARLALLATTPSQGATPEEAREGLVRSLSCSGTVVIAEVDRRHTCSVHVGANTFDL